MNRNIAPSRFINPSNAGNSNIRGRGGFKPGFYFRRNGRTIPAGGNYNPSFRGQRPRFMRRSAAIPEQIPSSGITLPPPNPLFLRSENFVAPENAIRPSSFCAQDDAEMPGWQLYFETEAYDKASDIAKKVCAIQKHFENHVAIYNMEKIKVDAFFVLHDKNLLSDENLLNIWPGINEDFLKHPLKTLATFGAAMYSLVSKYISCESSSSQGVPTRSMYIPQNTRASKIYARRQSYGNLDGFACIQQENVDCVITVRGYATEVSAVNASFSWIAYKCSRCKQEQVIKQTGPYVVKPYNCKTENCLAKSGFVEMRSSPFTRVRPVQTVRVVEQTFRDIDFDDRESIEVELRHDLVDKLIPSQEYIVSGVLKIRPIGDPGGNTRLIQNGQGIQFCLQALNYTETKYENYAFTERDLQAISMINNEPEKFKLLVQSLAPEAHGHEIAKAAILLSLFGGSGSQVHDDSDINILLVGDPGVGKSHILQMSSKVSEKGLFVKGKGGVFASKPFICSVDGRSKNNIKSGVILLSNSGHTAVDDIDRLASNQSSLHQILESHILFKPLPTIHFSLNLPISIIATANPTRGHYDRSKYLSENIRVNRALVNKFHLVFVLSDKPDKNTDVSLTEHVRALHAGVKKSTSIAARFARRTKINDNSMNITNEDLDLDDQQNNTNYDLSERLKLNAFEEQELDLIPPILIKKFIIYARQQLKPLLTTEAIGKLREFYLSLLKEHCDGKLTTITIRHLHALILLTQARARMDFVSGATVSHVNDVICIMQQSFADLQLGDYVDSNPATNVVKGNASMVKKFLKTLQMRSSALHRRIFEFDELKDIARYAGISCEIRNVVDAVNLQGYLLKKGPDLYELLDC